MSEETEHHWLWTWESSKAGWRQCTLHVEARKGQVAWINLNVCTPGKTYVLFLSRLGMFHLRMWKFFSFLIALNLYLFIGENYYSIVFSSHIYKYLLTSRHKWSTLQISRDKRVATNNVVSQSEPKQNLSICVKHGESQVCDCAWLALYLSVHSDWLNRSALSWQL